VVRSRAGTAAVDAEKPGVVPAGRGPLETQQLLLELVRRDAQVAGLDEVPGEAGELREPRDGVEPLAVRQVVPFARASR
jgi:hypothetical protein